MIKIKRKVLIVDDSPTTLVLLEKLLTNDGMEVSSLMQGQAVVATALAEHPHCILLDVLLMDIDGKEVVRQLKAHEMTADIPIIFLTNTVALAEDKGDAMITVDGQAYRAFAKPVHPRKLLSVTRKAINFYLNQK